MSNDNTNNTQSNTTGDEYKVIEASAMSHRVVNPIRAIVDSLNIPKGTAEKPFIPLSIGDPTVFGNLPPPKGITEKLSALLSEGKSNGYIPSHGAVPAREAIAKKNSVPGYPVTAGDVVVTSGCSGAIEIVLPTLANPGDTILIPRPGFSLYETVARKADIEIQYYDLDPASNWEIKLSQVTVSARCKAILVNNPSNPCGSNWSREHIMDILAFARKHKLVIIADEIYEDIVFSGERFHSFASLSQDVPVLSLGGIAKQYLVPGWRIGWVVVHDRHGVLSQVRAGLIKMSQVILGGNSLIQAALPYLLEQTDPAFYADLNTTLEAHASHVVKSLSQVPGLNVIKPQGAMYVMTEILLDAFADINDDLDFSQKLMDEEFVFVLPGSCFQAKNFFRIVFCAPLPMLTDACDRIKAFVLRHAK